MAGAIAQGVRNKPCSMFILLMLVKMQRQETINDSDEDFKPTG